MPSAKSNAAAGDADLVGQLALYDGKHTDLLEQIDAARGGELEPRWIDRLLRVAKAADGPTRSGSIWLLRRAHRRGALLSEAQSRAVVALLRQDRHWEQTINLLQILDTLAIPAGEGKELYKFLYAATEHANPLVRAWAISALMKIGTGPHRSRIDRIVAAAERGGTAAMKARIRRARQELARASRRATGAA